jgi:glyoxylase-like metal-dependent hydrolase (beta-lactamase superfamily II)
MLAQEDRVSRVLHLFQPLGTRVTATFHILQEGQIGDRVRSTVVLVEDGPHLIVIDPGMAPSQKAITSPLSALGHAPADVTDVIVSHHHPDHTVNVGLFGEARVHDYWATYHYDQWTSRSAEGFSVSESVGLWLTPGHTREDITTIVETSDGDVACTHLWWHADGPPEDPYAVDLAQITNGRKRVLESASLIIPGHGAPFRPSDSTPR